VVKFGGQVDNLIVGDLSEIFIIW